MWKKIISSIFLLSSLFVTAQTTYKISGGVCIPNSVSNKYLKQGVFFSYGVNFKISEHLFADGNVSVTYNSKNPSYRFGFDDEPYYIENPIEKKIQEDFITTLDYYRSIRLYLFNPSININLGYILFTKKRVSPYLLFGLSTNYSILDDPIEEYDFNEEGEITGSSIKPGKENAFNLGITGGLGFSYKLKNSKTIFVEANYRILPSVQFGRNDDYAALFLLHAGMNFPFKRK